MLLSMEIAGVVWCWYVKKDGSSSAGAIIPNGNKGPSGPILKNLSLPSEVQAAAVFSYYTSLFQT